MQYVVAVSSLVVTVAVSLVRPKVGRHQIQPAHAAILGALLTLASGLLDTADLERIVDTLSMPIVTIIALMAITSVAERAGFFRLMAWRMARAARGDARRLFRYLFCAGVLTGALFTNDAAVLIFTPMVFELVEAIQGDDWQPANKIPYYFAVLYVANLVGPLVISNPINIIAARVVGIGFTEYALWMLLPALVSILVTYAGLRFVFRRALPERYHEPAESMRVGVRPALLGACSVVLVLTLLAFFSEPITGLPTAYVAVGGAVVSILLYVTMGGGSVRTVARGVGWDAIIFVIGIFIVANGLRTVGLTSMIAESIVQAAALGEHTATMFTAFLAAFSSAVLNNHPVADVMALTIRDLALEDGARNMKAFAALIGGDLGPKMLPIGSLAALLWFRILRQRGVDISYGLYIRIGIPVTIAAVFLSTAVLILQSMLLP